MAKRSRHKAKSEPAIYLHRAKLLSLSQNLHHQISLRWYQLLFMTPIGILPQKPTNFLPAAGDAPSALD